MSKRIALTVLLSLWVVAAATPEAWAGPARRDPHVGYLFPAGGRQGTEFEVAVGGQFLGRTTGVIVSGKGVRASVVKHYRGLIINMPEQRKAVVERLRELFAKRLAESPQKGQAFWLPGIGRIARRDGRQNDANKMEAPQTAPSKMPEHPMLRDLDKKSLRQLVHITSELLDWGRRRKRQRNAQLGEIVIVKVTVDPGAPPGDRALRLRGPNGLTNPMCFQVGALPEVHEQEPNDPGQFAFLPREPAVNVPVLVNGQIMPGDVDRIRFRAKKGQQLVIQVHARHLVPFLADAVPGWFQATVALYDAKGKELAFADDYRFQPDPVLFFRVPGDGEYELEIRDSIYRGREDFVYRVAIGELPFITRMFPLGGRQGAKTVAAVDGWNLPAKRLVLSTAPGSDWIRQTALRQAAPRQADSTSNTVTYAVDTLPERTEAEPNNNASKAQRVALPTIVNGRIDRPGDVDVFRIEGRAGDPIVVDVTARRLHSPLDSLVRVTDASGRVLAWNDDHMQKDGHLHLDMGRLTHHADSYVTARLPADGICYVHVSDAQHHGSGAHAYRLRISAPRPDFVLYTVPSGLNVQGGRSTPVTVHALRKDGFTGEIKLGFEGEAKGFKLGGGRIPAGRDHVRITLETPTSKVDRLATLRLVGVARIGDTTVSRPAIPADDVMQAFLWRHLVPAEAFTVAVRKSRWRPLPVKRVGQGPVRVPVGGMGLVRFKAPKRLANRKFELKPSGEPPKGIDLAIRNVTFDANGLTFQLKVDGEAAKPGFADNLIVEVFTEVTIKPRGKDKEKATPRKRRLFVGVLPAIPFVVVERQVARASD